MGLTFRGVALQDGETPWAAKYWFDLIKGLPGHEPVEVRGDDILAPGRPGWYRGNRVEDHLDLLLEGFIKGEGADPEERTDDWHATTQTIMAAFQMDLDPGTLIASPGSNGYLGLVDDAEIAARTVDVMAGPIISRMSYQKWSIKLEAIGTTFWDLGSS